MHIEEIENRMLIKNMEIKTDRVMASVDGVSKRVEEVSKTVDEVSITVDEVRKTVDEVSSSGKKVKADVEILGRALESKKDKTDFFRKLFCCNNKVSPERTITYKKK